MVSGRGWQRKPLHRRAWREDVQELERLPLVFTWEQERIFPGIYLLGQISTTVPSEMGEKPFRILQNGRYLPDTMEDEQLLVIRTPQGLAVFAGCAIRAF